MASTFINLCSYADWSEAQQYNISENTSTNNPKEDTPKEMPTQTHKDTHRLDLNYDIHIHLPATRDQAVYDALFASLAKHIPLK